MIHMSWEIQRKETKRQNRHWVLKNNPAKTNNWWCWEPGLIQRPNVTSEADSTPVERPKWCLPVLKAPRLGVGVALSCACLPGNLERWEAEGSACVCVGARAPRYWRGWGREGAEAWPDWMCDWVGGWVSACLLSLVFSSQAKGRRETKFRAWSLLPTLPSVCSSELIAELVARPETLNSSGLG